MADNDCPDFVFHRFTLGAAPARTARGPLQTIPLEEADLCGNDRGVACIGAKALDGARQPVLDKAHLNELGVVEAVACALPRHLPLSSELHRPEARDGLVVVVVDDAYTLPIPPAALMASVIRVCVSFDAVRREIHSKASGSLLRSIIWAARVIIAIEIPNDDEQELAEVGSHQR